MANTAMLVECIEHFSNEDIKATVLPALIGGESGAVADSDGTPGGAVLIAAEAHKLLEGYITSGIKKIYSNPMNAEVGIQFFT